MTPRKKTKRVGARRAPERRQLQSLREVLDELIALVRQVSQNATHMTDDELAYAQQRLEWLADEIWRLAVEGDDGGSAV